MPPPAPLTRETKKAMQENKNTIMWQMTQDIDHVNAKLAFDAAAKGDETAQKVVDSWIEYVGVGIANVINTFEPEVICIGGGVSNQGEVLLAPVRAYAENETRNITTGKFPAICACTLRNDAGGDRCGCSGKFYLTQVILTEDIHAGKRRSQHCAMH